MGVSYLLRQMSGPLGGSDESRQDSTQPDPEALPSERQDGETASLGPLLDERNPKKVVAAIVKNWKSQDDGLSRHLAEVEQAEGWRAAERFLYLRRTNNDRQWEVWRPPGIDRLPALPDKVDELCRRFAAQMTVDKPVLEAEPATGAEADVESAEMASKIFQVEGGESGWNFRLIAEAGIDMATTQKSAFAHVWVNPVGRGEKPVTVMADAAATQYDAQNPQACTIDPQTGQPSANLVTKFLDQDQVTLTPAETATTWRRWVPWIEVNLLGVRNVRFLPEWNQGIQTTDGLIVADYRSIGELKQRYPETVGRMGNDDLKALVNWKPLDDDYLLPLFVRDPQKVGTWMQKDEVPDDAIALVFWEYHKQSPVYPKGGAICVGGGKFALAQDTLEAQVERPDGTTVPEVLEIPVSQCKCLNDWIGASPYGQALVTKMGPWSEMMSQQWVALQEFLDRFNNPFMFLPIGSSVQPEQVAQRDGRPILTNPNGAPVMETVPDISGEIGNWYQFAVTGLNSASLLSETANATELPNVNSGVQADTIINQVQVALSSAKANADDFLTRLGRLVLQRLRAHITVPQTVKYVGDDGAFKADEWRGADLYGATDIRIGQGSFTMMREDQKRQIILTDVQNQILPLDDAKDMLIEGTSAQVGLEDDPVRLRIRRQVDAFFDRGAPFEPLPVDDVPAIAHTRFRELAKQMMTTRYAKITDPNAKQAYEAEYNRARQAAGVLTTAESSQQQQAAQQAEVQAKVAPVQAKGQSDAQVQQLKTQGDIQVASAKAQIDTQARHDEAMLESTIPAAAPRIALAR